MMTPSVELEQDSIQNQTTATALELVVIIVTWNTRDLAVQAVRSALTALESGQLHGRVMVVDNASADGTSDTLRHTFRDHPALEVIDAGANLGFGAANNLALRKLGFNDHPVSTTRSGIQQRDTSHLPRAVLFLNPDTITPLDALRTLADGLNHAPRAGGIGACLQYEDGSFQHAAFRFPRLRQLIIDLYPLPNRIRGWLYETTFNGRYPRALYERSARTGTPFRVDFMLGAAMMVTREALERVGLFDEQFFMYCEEVDLALRMRKAGFLNYIEAAICITHLESRSASQVKPRSLINLWTSRHKYYRKHLQPFNYAIARVLARIGFQFRLRALRRDQQLDAAERDALMQAYRLADRAWSGKTV